MDIHNKGIILITKCCGKGWNQATSLIKRLNDEGLVYDLHSLKPKSCLDILERHGISLEDANKSPHVYIEDVVIPAASLNDARFVEDLIENLRKIKNEKDRLESENNKQPEVVKQDRGEGQ